MRFGSVAACLLAFGIVPGLGAVSLAGGPIVDPVSRGRAVSAAVGAVAPAVVRIVPIGGVDAVAAADDRNAAASLRAERTVGPTTGLVVSSDGWIVTSSFAFLGEPAAVLVELPDGRTFSGRRVAEDRSTLLTLLKIETEGEPLTAARPADPGSIAVGSTVIAVGRAIAADRPHVAVGIVSAENRIRGRAVQTDAKVSPLNYGGPLMTLDGRVLGVLTPLGTSGADVTVDLERYDSGTGFAVPLADILARLPTLKSGEDVRPGLFGMTFRGSGLLVAPAVAGSVRPGSPADEAGLEPGDEIVAVDGEPVDRQVELLTALGRRYAGETASVEYLRDGERLTGTATLAAELVPFEQGLLGLVLTDGEAGEGPRVLAVEPGSSAEAAGFTAGDVINAIDDRPVATRDDAAELLRGRAPGETVSVVRRTGEPVPPEIALGPASATPFPVPAVATADEVEIATEEFPDSELSGWSVTPTGLPRPGVFVFLHPQGNPMRAAAVAAARRLATERGLATLGVLAAGGRWRPDDLDRVGPAVEAFLGEDPLGPRRVVIGGAGTGAALATAVAFADRERFRGLIVLDADPRATVPPNDPATPLSVLIRPQAAGEVGRLGAVLEGERYPLGTLRIPEDRVPAVGLPEGAEPAFDFDAIAPAVGSWIDSVPRL